MRRSTSTVAGVFPAFVSARRHGVVADRARAVAAACVPVVVATCVTVLAGCVTRNKHTAEVGEWQGRLGTALADKEKLEKENKDALAARDDEITALRGTLDEALKGAKMTEADLAARLEARKEEIAALRKQRERIEASLAQYKKLREAFQKMISAGEIKVYRRRGRLMVALPSSVLFPSGKASLSRAGKRALAQVGSVLQKLPERRFLVAGHTDNVPIGRAEFDDNWQLSSERALGVTRFLIENGMQPTSLSAAGYGEHDPIRPNSSADNRARNRRIEIILMPNIDELPDIDE